ncbi:MAG: PspC domain-containing protein [Bacteroidia bacterium]
MEKRLVRKDKKFLGVCGGLGAYFETDPVLFRLLFVVAVVVYGTGVLLYFIMALIMPEEGKAQ